MRNLKKFLALVLAMMMVLSVAVISTSAAADADYTDAANHLASLQVMKGNEKGDLMLENGVTRYQAALFFVQALTGKTDAATWNATKKSAYFTDVPEYGTAIDYAYGLEIVKGRGNGEYGYNDAITYQDMLVMAVRALGYETEGMSYPYGYILAAQKLGLTDNVDLVDYKAALTRGATAQIIWDMLNTEVAVVDPLTDKVLYPGETGLTDAIVGAQERVTLLVDSGLAGAKLTGIVVEFVEADEDDEESFDVVTVALEEVGEIDFAAADFGITADTRVVDYLGLPVEVYVSVDADEFTQAAYDDEDATVVSATFPEYTTVVNLGDAGNIKYVVNASNADKNYLALNGVKFADDKYDVVAYTFSENGWAVNNDVDLTVFEYTTKDGYVSADLNNSNVSVAYRVIEAAEDEEKGTVEVLYTEFQFGQYNVREINDNKYTVIGTYEDTAVENMDEEMSYFVEYLVDGAQKITSATKTVSNKKGEAALNVVVEGETVAAGDFMFYAYNSVDNVLTVAANCGTFQTGRLTAKNDKNETVKINGTSVEVGFKGAYAADFAADYVADLDAIKGYITGLEAGKDNVKYIAVDGNVVYMEAATEATTASTFDFAIVTTDVEIMADLLEMTEAKYEEALTCGLYVDGEVKVAMMNLATGAWELVSIETYAANWDDEEAEFTNEYDLADAVKYYDITNNVDKYGYVDDFAALVAGGMVAVVEENNGVYTIAANEDEFFVYGDTEDGLLFSDTSAKTNAITADNDVDAARVTLDAESVVVVLADGIGSRVGVQTAETSVAGAGKFYAASADLIVFVPTDDSFDVVDWADAKTANSDENWYITTANTGVEVEATDDEDVYVVTITDVYDMKAMEIIASIQTEVEDLADVLDLEVAGVVLKKEANGDIAVTDEDLATIIAEVASDNEKKNDYEAFNGAIEFVDAETIVLEGKTNKVDAYDINVTVVTLNNTGLDVEDYDFEAVVSAKEWTEDDEDINDVAVAWGDDEKVFCEYLLDTDLVAEINEPTEGVFDQAVIDNADAILVPEMDNEDYEAAIAVDVELYYAVDVDSIEDGIVNLVVYKVLVLAD